MDVIEMIMLARPQRFDTFPQAATTAGHNNPNENLRSEKVTERCRSSCPHLWIDHTSLSAIWPLNTRRKSQACDRAQAPKSTLWPSEMFHFLSSGRAASAVVRGCASHLNAKRETSAWSHRDSSLCHFPSRAASSPALPLRQKWEGGGEKN